MIIRDILTVKKDGVIFSVAPDQTIAEAIDLMVKSDIGSLVVHRDGHMTGLLTERDVLRGISREGAAGLGRPVSSMMVGEPIFGSPDDTVDYVRGVMTENCISHLLVMEGDNLLGVISYHDVAKACLNQADFENTLLKRYIKHWPE